MSGHQIGTRIVAAIDVVLSHGYPATAFVELVNFPGGPQHWITYAGVPAALFDNAPNGSHFIDTTNGDTYVKTLAIGSGIAGTWTQT